MRGSVIQSVLFHVMASTVDARRATGTNASSRQLGFELVEDLRRHLDEQLNTMLVS